MKLYNFNNKNYRRTILIKNRNLHNDLLNKEKKEKIFLKNYNSKQIKYRYNNIQFLKSKTCDEYNDSNIKNNSEQKNNEMNINQNYNPLHIRKSFNKKSHSERTIMDHKTKDNILQNNKNLKLIHNKPNSVNEYNICLNEFSSRNNSSKSFIGYELIKKNPIIKDLFHKIKKYPSSYLVKKSSILYQKRKSVINDLLLSTYNEKDKDLDVFNKLCLNDNIITPSFSNSFISNKISVNEYKKKLNFIDHLDLKLYPDTTKNEKQKFRQQKKLITPYSYKILQNKINQIILNKNQIENSIQVFNKKFKVNNNEAKKKFSKNNNLDKSIDSNEKINHPNHLMKENIYKNDKLNDIITNNYNSSLNNKIKLGEKKNIDYCNSNELTSSLDNNNCLFCKLTSKYY
jgi:hypothetical protein